MGNGAGLRKLPPFMGIGFRKGVERAKEEVRRKGEARAEEAAVKDEEGEEGWKPMIE